MKTIRYGCGLLLSAALLVGCGSEGSGPTAISGPSSTVSAAQVSPSDFPGSANTTPAQPASGSRPGEIYDVYVTGALGEKVAFTVFEPTTLTAGQSYPLVLHSHGFSGSRVTGTGQGNPASPGDVDALLAAGYGVISIDERGHGESTGTIRVMDPDFEGVNLIRILNWAETHLPWLKYGTGANGQPNNLVLGAIGGSYGGMYQYVIQNIDPKQRLDALSAQIAPNDLTYSLFPNGVIKTEWDLALFALGNTAGSQGGTAANFDPFVTKFFQDGFSSNSVNKVGRDFFYYHSNAYFCNGVSVATNGGANTKPAFAPTNSPKVNVMLFQGMRDTLFNFTEAVRNYRCFKAKGGDVRLFGYQSGHNTIFAPTIDDPGLVFQPGGAQAILDSNCGNINVNDATVKFFNLHLKGIANADAGLPKNVCLSLASGDAVLLDDVPDTNRADTSGKTVISQAFSGVTIPVVPNTTPLSGGPYVVDMGYTAPAGGAIMGGIGRLTVKISNARGGFGDPILFFGVGHQRAGGLPVWDLIDNQILPIRGVGTFTHELVGVAERLAPGDKLALLIYGGNRQYLVNGSLSVPAPFIGLVQVDGTVTLPILGNLPNIATLP